MSENGVLQMSSNSSSNDSQSESSDEYEIFQQKHMMQNNAIITQQLRNNIIIVLVNYEIAPLWGVSVPGRATINRGRVNGNNLLKVDYFGDSPTYGHPYFRRRFRMSRDLFLRIRRDLKHHSPTWKKQINAAYTVGLSLYKRIGASIQMLAYGAPADSLDQYFRMAETTTLSYLKELCRQTVLIYSAQYLREPNAVDVARLLEVAEMRGFPGMLGSLDCMHWRLKNCPTEWVGQYKGRNKVATIILEVVASYDLWIWHAYFGLPGSNNDIRVLEQSHLFINLALGRAPPANYTIWGRNYTTGY